MFGGRKRQMLRRRRRRGFVRAAGVVGVADGEGEG